MSHVLSPNVIWLIATVLELCVAAAILLRRRVRIWPFLLVTMTMRIVRTCVVFSMAAHGNRVGYFYAYWVGESVFALLNFGIIADVVRAVPGLRRLPDNLKLGAVVTAITVFLVSVVIEFQDHVVGSPWAAIAVDLQRCVAVGWLATFILLLTGISFLGMAWQREAHGVAAGALAAGIATVAAAYAVTHHPASYQIIDLRHAYVESIVFLCWAALLSIPSNVAPKSEENSAVALLLNGTPEPEH